eukprot:68869_1
MNETQFLDINIRNPSQTRGYYVKYAYKIYSKSKPNPIVLLAGWIQCKENWYDFISYLAKTRMVIVMDHRGIGESKIIFNPNNPNTNTSTIPSFTLSDLSSDIVTLIEYIFGVNKISKTKIDIMGFSLGGMIAQQLAIEYPQYVSNLILCSTTPAGGRHIPFIKSITKQWFKSQSKISQITNKIELKKFLIESALFSLGPLYDKTNKINMERVSDYVSMTMELNKPLQTSMTQLKAMAKWNGIKQLKILNKYSNDYLYLDSIKFILKMKTGLFHEHSPLLFDISGVPFWFKVKNGLLKMYQDDVLKKLPVVQHFL